MTDCARVLIVAGYPSVRAGLHALLSDADGLTVLGAVEGAGETLARLLPELSPQAVLLDTAGWDRSGSESLNDLLELLAINPAALIILGDTPENDLPLLAEADLPGYGYLLRQVDGPQIVAAVRAAAAGLTVLDRGLPLPLLSPVEDDPENLPAAAPTQEEIPGETLTPREIEVLELMAQGLPNKIIAARLKISLHTAKFHVAQILGKLNAASRTEAVTTGARRGYVTL
ncbi:MAG: response regulator transcription factor [Capsulimonadales bacterium]|nr:response regulator transcription factor [Capsulimonadales bacterium]